MREKLSRFMQGRYGNDRLNQVLMIAAILFLVLSMFGLKVCYTVAILFMVYGYFRMLSKNIYRRAAENQWYLKREVKVRNWIEGRKRILVTLKTHHIYKCPNCRQKLRVPKGRGKIEISCRKCGTKFIKKS